MTRRYAMDFLAALGFGLLLYFAGAGTAHCSIPPANADVNALRPAARVALDCVLSELPQVYLVEGHRSAERQAALYAQGRTEPGPIVTWTPESWHQTGYAVDLAFSGEDPWSPEHPWGRLRNVAFDCGLEATAWGLGDLGHYVAVYRRPLEPLP